MHKKDRTSLLAVEMASFWIVIYGIQAVHRELDDGQATSQYLYSPAWPVVGYWSSERDEYVQSLLNGHIRLLANPDSTSVLVQRMYAAND